MRLCTDQRSLKLHRLRWETLRLPDRNHPNDLERADWLAVDQRVLFSRHLFSADMRPVRLRPQADLSALIAIASPTDVAIYSAGGRPLAPIRVDDERTTAEQGLRALKKVPLGPETPGGVRVTLQRLLDALRKEPDVLYLVCHGAMVDGEPRLLLERDDGTGHVVSGLDLVREFARLRTLPRLVVLISCQSGGDEPAPDSQAERAVLSAIGPVLAEAGVPAVLAMQGDLSMATARAFLPPFFESLWQTGQVDEAVTRGRGAIPAGARDGWVPVLYTRLVEGRVWFRKGLTARDGFNAWPQLVQQIRDGKCVPILGPGLLEPFVGTTRELANALAQEEGYPLALSGSEYLPQITQFIKTMKDDNYARSRLRQVMEEAVQGRWPGLAGARDLRGLLAAAWEKYQADNPFEPHRYLAARGQFKAVITTNPDDLMGRAFAAADRPARAHVCQRDDEDRDEDEDRDGRLGALRPTLDAPHVYQMYGHLSEPNGVVVTEDDYFRFLTAMTRRGGRKKDESRSGDLNDTLLRGTLAASGLIFLGFRITDWDFRTLFGL